MKLLFWKPKRAVSKGEPGQIKSKEEYIRDYLNEGAIVNEPSRKEDEGSTEPSTSTPQPTRLSTAKTGSDSRSAILSTQEERRMDEVIKQVMEDRRRYKVLVIKNWCETKLTPVAYARVLVRLLPVLREYGYDFKEMQHPTEQTRVKRDFFLLIQATIREIYKEEYNKKEVKEESV